MKKQSLTVLLLFGLLLCLLASCGTQKENGKGATIREFVPQEPYTEEDLPAIQLTKTVYHRSESIELTCRNTDDGDLIRIYREGETRGSADPIHEKVVCEGTLSFNTGLMTPGVYSVYLLDDDGLYVHDTAEVRIYNQEDQANYGPTAAKIYLNGEDRICVDIQPETGLETMVEYRIYWAKAGNLLEDYTVAHICTHRGSEPFTVMLNEGAYMPQEADGVIIMAMAGGENMLFITAPEEMGLQESKLLYRYNILSDLHVSPSWPSCNAMVKKAFQDIIAQGYSSVIFTLGDNTERGQENEYELLKSIVTGAGEKLPNIYYAMGNHDIVYNNNAGYDKQLALFQKYTGMPGAYYAVELNGHFHIILGSDTLSHLGTIGQEQQDWLKAQLEKTDTQSPIFIYLHQPLKDTTSGTLYTKYNKSQDQDSFGILDDTKALREILKNYPNAILLTGHTHRSFLSEQPVLLGGGKDANFVACSTVGKADGGSEGIYVEVYEDYVLIRGRDFANEQWCGCMQIKIPLNK